MTPPTLTNRPLASIPLCVFGLFLFSVQDVFIKLFSDTYSVLQIVFVRCTVALLPIIIILLCTRRRHSMRAAAPRLLLFRGFLGFFSYLTYYMAMAAMPLVDVVTILFLSPMLVTMLSGVLLKEAIGVRRWTALVVGFIAIVMVVGPSGDIAHLATLLALFTAFCYGLSVFLTRFVSGEAPWVITLYTMLAFVSGSVVASALVIGFGGAITAAHPSLQFLLRPWVVPPLADGMLMIFLGLNAALAFYCLIQAYRLTAASVVAPFEYTYAIWAVLFGYLVWDEIPQTISLCGLLLLLTAGYYIFRRELRLHRQAARAMVYAPRAAPGSMGAGATTAAPGYPRGADGAASHAPVKSA